LFFEYGYIFGFDNEGKTKCHELFPSDTTVIGEFNENSNINVSKEAFVKRKSKEEYDNVRVFYPVIKTINNAVIAIDQTNGTANQDCLITLLPNEYMNNQNGTKTEFFVEYSSEKVKYFILQMFHIL
jgi:hypothetical protein